MRIRSNTAYNLLGSIIPLAVSLPTIPAYLGLIGEARYGVLAIAWLLLGYFGLFDLGLGRATAQCIAALRDCTAVDRAQAFWTALVLNVGLGILGGLLIWPIAAYFFANVFQVEDTLRPEIQSVVPWLILAVPVATISGVLIGALQGREQFLELNLISVFGTVLFQLLPLAIAMISGVELGLLLPAALLARLLTLVILFFRCRKHVFFGHPPTFVPAKAKQLLRFGGWVTITSFVSPMMVILDRFIIGAISGAKAVSYYSVPFQLGERSTIISSALAAALFPRFAAITVKEEHRLAHQALRSLVVVMTPLVVAGILFIEPFLSWWITPEFAHQSALVAKVILLGFWVNGFARIPSAQLVARGRPDIGAKCHLLEVLPYFGLLYCGLTFFGLVGAAVAFSLRMFVDFMLLVKFAGVLRESFNMLIVPSIFLALAFTVSMQILPGKPEWFALVFFQLAITTTWSWLQAPLVLQELFLAKLRPLRELLVKT